LAVISFEKQKTKNKTKQTKKKPLVGQAAEDENKNVLDLHHVSVTGFIPLLEYAYTASLPINIENLIDVLAEAEAICKCLVLLFMKASVLWNTPNSQPGKGLDAGQENSFNCSFTSQYGSTSPLSSDCRVVERTIPVCQESWRKRKSYIVMSPESPVKCSTQTSSHQVLNSSTSYAENRCQPADSSLKNDYVTSESTKTTLPLGTEEDVQVKVERLSDKEVHEEVSQPVSASQSSLSDQQTVRESESVQEDLLISPQSSPIGSVDEGVTVGFPTLQITSSTNAHGDRLEHVQYPFQLYIAPSSSSTEGPSPNDFLNQEQQEILVQYDLGENSFESKSSVQMPVISQDSSE
ncbi:hypothetical protein U0070_021121, partial [Myodes glareolus]